jgi:hypothetical protein
MAWKGQSHQAEDEKKRKPKLITKMAYDDDFI